MHRTQAADERIGDAFGGFFEAGGQEADEPVDDALGALLREREDVKADDRGEEEDAGRDRDDAQLGVVEADVRSRR